MSNHVVLRVMIRLLIPFILMFALYIQLHGEYSPGGGFQAGVIAAAAFIVYGLVHGLDVLKRVVPFIYVIRLSALGVLLYGCVGLLTVALGGEFLNYSVLHPSKHVAQQIGIVVIELGVGLTVFAVMMIIFYCFADRLNTGGRGA